jgi:hypothetical protein
MKKLALLGLCLCLIAPMGADAQSQGRGKKKGHYKNGHYMKMKPKAPKYTRVGAPGSGYSYVQEDWTWDQGNNNWVWNGNRWVNAPQPGKTWVAGHWQRSSGGWTWREGYWR